MASLAAQLAETASVWRNTLAPLVEWVADALRSSSPKPAGKPAVATRLTRRLNREAVGRPSLPELTTSPEQNNFCRICGTEIKPRVRYCPTCAVVAARENIAKVTHKGTEAMLSPATQAMRSETPKRHEPERKAWDAASHPAWLTEEVYRAKIQPLLKGISTSAVAKTLDFGWSYAAEVRKGRELPIHGIG
jgi:hypothetical protein